MASTESVHHDVRGLQLSGLERRPAGMPRAILLALHGGGYSAGYWDWRDGSLLQQAAGRGYMALAIDRPGYGGAFAHPLPLAEQADLLLDLAETLGVEHGRPVVLAGHSMGGILALMMAAHARSDRLAAIDVCGIPLRYPAESQVGKLQRPSGETHHSIPPRHVREMFYGPDGTFEPDALAYDAEVARPVPYEEMPDAAAAPVTLPQIMPGISLPVRYTLAEFEASSVADDDVAALARELLMGSRRSEVRFESGTGHNISLHGVAHSFHAGMLDAFDEVLP